MTHDEWCIVCVCVLSVLHADYVLCYVVHVAHYVVHAV